MARQRTKPAEEVVKMPEIEDPDKEVVFPLHRTEEGNLSLVPDRGDFVSTLYMVNPYTKVTFLPGEKTEDVKIDSWTKCQIEAGLLKEVK